jgi:hypothetical protein
LVNPIQPMFLTVTVNADGVATASAEVTGG